MMRFCVGTNTIIGVKKKGYYQNMGLDSISKKRKRGLVKLPMVKM